MFGISKQKFMM